MRLEHGISGGRGQGGDEDNEREVPQACARGDKDRKERGNKEHRRAQVRLEVDERDGHERDDRRGRQAHQRAVLLAEAQIIGQDEHKGDLGEFGGLDVHEAQVDPGASAIDGAHDALGNERDEHEDEQAHRAQHREPGEQPDDAVVGERDDQCEHKSERDEHQLRLGFG